MKVKDMIEMTKDVLFIHVKDGNGNHFTLNCYTDFSYDLYKQIPEKYMKKTVKAISPNYFSLFIYV
jgi:hypothetical protein